MYVPLVFAFIETWTRNATCCNNHYDLLHLSFILKISIFSEAYIYNSVKHLWWSFYCKNSKPLSIFTKKHHSRCSLGFQIRPCFALLTHQVPVLPTYGNQSIDLYSKSNQLTGFYMRPILALNGLMLLFHWIEQVCLLTTC